MKKKAYRFFQFILFSLTYYILLSTPYRFVFQETQIVYKDLVLDILISSLLLIDIFLRLRDEKVGLAYRILHLEEVGIKKKLYTFFDFLAAVPFDLILFIIHPHPMWFLARALRIVKFIGWADRTYHSIILSHWFKSAMALSFVMLFVHWTACAWIWIYPQNVDTWTQYNQALYWAVTTLTTIGYGDITPTTNAGRIFTIFIMISGVGLYSFFIGAVSGMILAANKHKDALKEKVKDLSDFMSYYEIPGRIRSEVFTFIKHMSEQRLSDNDARIISDLPTALQKDLKTYMCVRSIRSVRIFNDCSIDCLKAVGEKLHQICLSPGQVVIQQGDLGHEMYIIGHGKLSVRSESGDVLALLVDGQVFGEMALLEDETRSATVQADSYCDLYVLEKEDFLGIHQQFPEVQKNVREIIERRKQKSGSVS